MSIMITRNLYLRFYNLKGVETYIEVMPARGGGKSISGKIFKLSYFGTMLLERERL